MRYFIILMNAVNNCSIRDCLLLYFIIDRIDSSVHLIIRRFSLALFEMHLASSPENHQLQVPISRHYRSPPTGNLHRGGQLLVR